MKKAILSAAIIAVILSCVFAFTACNNATTQGQLENVWRPYEAYTYKVTDVDGTVGTYVVTIESFEHADVVIGSATLTNVKKGYLVSGLLTMGSTDYTTACYFNLIEGSNYLVPAASYRRQYKDGATQLEVQGSYDGAKFNYSGTKNSEAISGSVALSSPYYDNNEFHQTMRGASTFGDSFSFGFNVPVVAEEIGAISLTAAVQGKKDVTVPYQEAAINCYETKISRSTKVAGSSQTLYYAVDDIAGENGWKLPHVLVKIVEPAKDGDVVYELTKIALTKPAPSEG